jgi:6-pyruvoyltetrahydropterin/6-carboxytetrahydropterin synthase
MTARHRLPEAVPGERDEHAHHYVVEIMVKGSRLEPLGYLMDIDELKSATTEVLDRYRGSVLNELDDFSDVPPSMENLAQAISSSHTLTDSFSI